MSEHEELQALIDAATPALAVDADVAGAGADRFEEHATWDHGLRQRARKTRRILLGGGAIYLVLMAIITVDFFQQAQASVNESSVHYTVWRVLMFEMAVVFAIPIGLVTTAAWLVGRRGFAAQVGGRAILWGLTLLVGLFEVVAMQMASGDSSKASGVLPGAILVASLSFVGALLSLGDRGLRSPARGAFRPVAFRRLLSLSLVIGLADAVIIGSIFAFVLALGRFEVLWFGLCAMLCVSAYGLFRLRTWGLAAMAASNLAEIVLAVNGQLSDTGPLIGLLMVTAAVQLLLPVPVYGAMLRGRVLESGEARWTRHVPTVILVLVAVAAVLQFVWAVLR